MLEQSVSRGGWPGESLVSRNARAEKALIGRAQLGTHPGHPEKVNEQAITIVSCLLRPCLGQGASWRARVGR